ncbi:Pantothenate kinase PanK and related proteins [Phaffia rhodozyma]|uniref:Pantothenate kinase PanK and related proteins n=1 Tax=Phaffia rhodozyma TaxID=264483 RepID=A0A0F7SHJ4_PHARH|nr:Pantothenate kinase PanK and related proteins [Phaffia rhodozyma]
MPKGSADVEIPPPRSISVDTRGAQILMEDSPATRDSRGIYLPHHIEPVSHIAVDIGGSLAKIVYFTRSPVPPNGFDHSAPGSPTFPVQPSSPLSTSNSSSIVESNKPTKPNPNGALTPRILSSVKGADDTFSSSFSASLNLLDSSSGSSSTVPVDLSALSSSKKEQNSPIFNGNSQRRPKSSVCRNRSRQPKIRRATLPNLPGGLLNFTRFETSQIHECIEFISSLISQSATRNKVSIESMKSGVKIMATGGGAHKFYDLFRDELGVEVIQEEEMECLIIGLGFITGIPREVFWYSDELVYEISHLSLPTSPPVLSSTVLPNSSFPETASPYPNASTSPDPPTLPTPSSTSIKTPRPEDLPRPSADPPKFSVSFENDPKPGMQFPCLLVNIGSGVSIVKIDKDGSFERVSGTSLGGGTLWGLLSLLTDAESFDEMLTLSEKGDNAAVDMLVGDIYGQDYSKVGLKSSTIASSFGKVFQKGPRTADGKQGEGVKKGKSSWKQEDLAKSLLYAVSNNIGQIAHMNAEKYDLDRIYFGGCFIRGHPATISTLSYAIRFWSKGTKRAMFLRHEGFLGSIGAWIKNVELGPDSRGSPSPERSEQDA